MMRFDGERNSGGRPQSKGRAVSGTNAGSGVGGGPVASGGFNYQAAVTAIALAHTIRRTPLGWLDGLADDTPVAVSSETGSGGDDLRLWLRDGSTVEVQAKRSLHAGADLWKALDALADAISGPTNTFGLLVIGPGSSRTVAGGLADDIVKIGEDVSTNLRDLATRWVEMLTARGLDPKAICGRLRIVTIAAVKAEAADVRAARSELAQICTDAPRAWDRLYRDAHLMIEGRGHRTLEAVAQVLRSAGVGLRSDPAGPPAAVLERLCNWTVEVNAHFSILGVSAPLSIDSAWAPLIVRLYETAEPPERGLAEAIAKYHDLDGRPDQRDDGVTSPDAICRFYRRCVVVAGPGMGKSTLMTRLARRYAQDGFPVLKANARGVARRMAKNGESFLEAVFALALGECDVTPAAAQAAGFRNWVLLLDGLDETASEQNNVVQGLIAFGTGFPESRIVATTRPIGYRRSWLAHWRHYELVLERDKVGDQIRRLLEQMLAADDIRRPHLAGLVEEALERSQVGEAGLRSPLMLGLSAALFAHGDVLGPTRLAFYRAIFHLIESEPPPRAGSPPASGAILRRVLDALGWTLAERPLAQRDEALACCARILEPELRRSALEAQDLVESCVGYWEALGVVEQLHHDGLQAVAFVHKTFGEFAAGRWIAGLSAERQADLLTTRADDEGWREPVGLAAAMGAGGLVLDRLVARGFAGEAGQARLLQALEILQEADPALVGVAPDTTYAAALGRLDEDHRTWAFQVGMALVAIGARLPEAVIGELQDRLGHPQPWTRAAAWSVALAADPTRFDLDQLLVAVEDVAGAKDSIKQTRLGGQIVVGSADRHVLQEFCVRVIAMVLERHDAEAADAIIHQSLRPKSLQSIGFAMRVERLMRRYGLRYRWRELAGVGKTLAGFELPPDLRQQHQACLLGLVGGLCDGVPSDATSGRPGRPLFTLAALFELIGFYDTAISEIWHYRSLDASAVAKKVWRAVAVAAGLPLDQLAAEARIFVDALDEDEDEALSLVWKRLPRADLPEPRWLHAADLMDLPTLAVAMGSPAETLSSTALKFALATVPPERIGILVDTLLRDGTGNAVWAGCNLARRLPRADGIALLRGHVERGGGDLRQVYPTLADLGFDEPEADLEILRVGLMGQEPYAAIEAAKCLSQLSAGAANDIAASSYAHWLEHEEPYPGAGGGVVPPSPRKLLAPFLLERARSIDEVASYFADPRISNVAQSHFVARLQASAEDRAIVAEQIAAGRYGAALARTILRDVQGWSAQSVGTMTALFEHADGAMRLAALPLLLSDGLSDDDRLKWSAILRQDREPDIREAMVALLPKLKLPPIS